MIHGLERGTSKHDGAPPALEVMKVSACRDRAASLRDRAVTVNDPDMRNMMVLVADEWDRLAAEIEKIPGPGSPVTMQRGRMPDRFDDVIGQTLRTGAETHHDVMPSDFGEAGSRRIMFTRCLALLAERYPYISIRITGDPAALISLGLIPNGEMLVGSRLFRTRVGPSLQPDMVRLAFYRTLPA